MDSLIRVEIAKDFGLFLENPTGGKKHLERLDIQSTPEHMVAYEVGYLIARFRSLHIDVHKREPTDEEFMELFDFLEHWTEEMRATLDYLMR